MLMCVCVRTLWNVHGDVDASRTRQRDTDDDDDDDTLISVAALQDRKLNRFLVSRQTRILRTFCGSSGASDPLHEEFAVMHRFSQHSIDRNVDKES